MADCTNPDDFGLCASDYAAAQSDSITDAAVRAKGIDPATGQWIGGNASNYPPGTDPATIAAQARADAQAYYNQQLANNTAALTAQNKKCGGFLADLLNPFSPNIDPNQWNCKAANALSGVNWTALIALAVVLAILATVHQVKEIV